MSGYGVPPGASGPPAGSDVLGCVGFWTVMATSSWLLAASFAPVCVKCHHAGCVITRRIRASAGAILAAALIASDSLRH